jgi:predicted RNA binding protein with dsRBD fold (UPF0201 family)
MEFTKGIGIISFIFTLNNASAMVGWLNLAESLKPATPVWLKIQKNI